MHFKEEIEGLLRYIEDTQFKLDEINASDYIKSSGKAPIGRPDVQEINMASLDDLRALRESLAFLKSQVVQFNNLCGEGGFKDELARIPSQETPAGQNLRGQLGEQSRLAVAQKKTLAERLDTIGNVHSLFKQLEVDLAQLGQIGNEQKSLVS